MNHILPYITETERINNIVNEGAKKVLSDVAFWEKEIEEWLKSPVRNDILTAEKLSLDFPLVPEKNWPGKTLCL